MSAKSVEVRQHCTFLQTDVTVAAKEPSQIGTDCYEGDVRPTAYDCLDKVGVCYEHSCIFTTDGGEWPFALPRGQLEEQLVGGAGI